jgi:hypothetical protein
MFGRVWKLTEALEHVGLPQLGDLEDGSLDLSREAQTFPSCAGRAIQQLAQDLHIGLTPEAHDLKGFAYALIPPVCRTLHRFSPHELRWSVCLCSKYNAARQILLEISASRHMREH